MPHAPHAHRAWQIAEIVNLDTFIAARGFPFYLACLYIALVLLAAHIGLGVWVGWGVQNNRLDLSWWVEGGREG